MAEHNHGRAGSASTRNSNSRNRRMVAQHCSVTYLNPAQRGDRLTARAAERQRAGRSGIYDVAVTREDGTPMQ